MKVAPIAARIIMCNKQRARTSKLLAPTQPQRMALFYTFSAAAAAAIIKALSTRDSILCLLIQKGTTCST